MKVFVGVLVLCTCCSAAGGEVFQLHPIDRGFYGMDGGHVPSNLNYSVGNSSSGPSEHRNFFVFDMSPLVNPILGAELQLLFTGYDSPNPTETYTFYDITTPWEDLLDGDADVAGYEDLGTGTVYGQHVVSNAVEGVYFSVFLNAAALSDMNAATDLWGIGGAFTSLDGNINTQEAMAIDPPWSQDLTSTRLVITTIPAPGAMAALTAGALIVGRRRRR